LLIMFLGTVAPSFANISSIVAMLFIVVLLVEGIYLGRSSNKAVRKAFPGTTEAGVSLGFYAYSRATQPYNWRTPRPRVKRSSFSLLDFPAVPTPDAQARAAVATALHATPRGLSLGNFADPALWLAGCQGQVAAQAIQRARVIVFASNNAIAQRTFQGHGLSAFAPEATGEQIAEIEANIGPIHRLAIAADAS